VAEGYVWGRGAFDTRYLGVVHLLALERLVREGVTFRRPVIFLAVSDEETGARRGWAGWRVSEKSFGVEVPGTFGHRSVLFDAFQVPGTCAGQ